MGRIGTSMEICPPPLARHTLPLFSLFVSESQEEIVCWLRIASDAEGKRESEGEEEREGEKEKQREGVREKGVSEREREICGELKHR
jgi:hypothetical protein